jgi:signal transduction histidine kinase
MQTDFINIAAQELRTPIQSIIGYSELLQELLSSKGGQKDSQKRVSGSFI